MLKLQNNRCLPVIIFAYGCLLSALYAGTSVFKQDSNQLLQRGHIFVTEGRLVPYGSVASSGVWSYTPGSFLSAAVGIPMKIWDSPYAAHVMIGLLHALGLLMMLDLFRRLGRHRMIALYLILFWCNPWRTSEVFLWNPAYLFFFTCLHLWSAFRLSGRSSVLFSALHVLSIVGAMQVHSSFVILGFVSLMLLWKRAVRPNWAGVGIGVLLGGASLLPYILARIENPALLSTSMSEGGFLFRGLVLVYPVLKGVWYWIRHGSFVFPGHIFSRVGFDWVSSVPLRVPVRYSWLVVTNVVGGATVLGSLWANYRFARANGFTWRLWSYSTANASGWLQFYIVISFWGLLIASAMTPTDIVFWHLLLLFPVSIVVPLLAIERLWGEPRYAKWVSYFLAASLIYFGLFAAVTSVQSENHSLRARLDTTYQEMFGR
jgi:hypothetical protein